MTRTSALPRVGSLTHRVGTLAMAAMLALTVAGSLAAPALAKGKHPADNGVRCVYYNQQTGEIEFYVYGDLLTVGGKEFMCGTDGNWFALRESAPLSPVGAVAPQSPPAAAQQ